MHASGRLFLHNNMEYINKQVSKYLYMKIQLFYQNNSIFRNLHMSKQLIKSHFVHLGGSWGREVQLVVLFKSLNKL